MGSGEKLFLKNHPDGKAVPHQLPPPPAAVEGRGYAGKLSFFPFRTLVT